MNEKGLAPIVLTLAFVLVAILFGLIYYYQMKSTNQIHNSTQITKPSSTITQNNSMSIYTNTKFGYSFQYPDNLEIKLGAGGLTGDEANLNTASSVVINLKTDPHNEFLSIYVVASKTAFANVDDYEIWLEHPKQMVGTEMVSTPSAMEKTTLDQINAIEYKKEVTGSGNTLNRAAVSNGYLYSISLVQSDSRPENIPIFNQILSTFKFTN